MRSPSVPAALAVAGALLLAAGCGGGGKTSDADSVKATWTKAATAAVDGQGTTFCELVTDAGKAQITSRTQLPCEDSIRLLASQLSVADKAKIKDAQITKVSVAGDKATVTYATTPTLATLGFTGRTTLSRSGGDWLLVGI